MKKILIIGFGYWGSRIFKTINKINAQKYKIIVFDSLPRNKNQYYHKNVDYVNNYQELNFSVIDYFIISTSISSHLFFIKKLAKFKTVVSFLIGPKLNLSNLICKKFLFLILFIFVFILLIFLLYR